MVDQNDATVSQYMIGAGGLLSPLIPATVTSSAGPFGVAVNVEVNSAYVVGVSDNTVFQYSINPLTGALSPKTPATVAAEPGAAVIAVSPDSKSAYVAGGGVLSQYNIDAVTGALSPKNPATVAAVGAVAIAVTPDGKSVYAPSPDGTVSQYTIDPSSGALSPKTPATVAAGAGPMGIAVSPDGKNAYVTNGNDNTVSQYNVNPVTGALSPKTPATVAAGLTPFAVAVTTDGKNAYVTDIGNIFHGVGAISQYNIDPSSGALSPKTTASVGTGGAPKGIAIGPLPGVHATSTSVSCSPTMFAPGDAAVCRATVADRSSGGQTTPTGTVSFTSSGAGGFSGGGSCRLVQTSTGVAGCDVGFSSLVPGGRIIAAGYGGDATHSASSAITGVTVAMPASTAGCVAFGHGRITAANGDTASFRGLVVATSPRGVEFYRDTGPADAMRVLSTSVDAVTCSADATRASVFGTAKVNGAGSIEYRVDVQLRAWRRGKDTYRIRLGSGYDSGAQPIRHGDVEIRTHRTRPRS